MSSNRAEEWKKIAKDLYSALLRSSGECGESNHAGGLTHESHEACPVILARDNAMINYQNKNQLEKSTL